MEKIKNNKTLLIIITIIVGLLIAGGTYALITSGILVQNGTYNAVTASNCINVTYTTNDNSSSNITGDLLPSTNASKGLKTKLSVNITNTCDFNVNGMINLFVDSSTSSKYISTVSAHCENPNTLETLTNYKTSESCNTNNGRWVTNGTALKYAVYNNDTATGNPLSKGYINTTNSSITIYNNLTTTTSTNNNYYLYVWLDGNTSDNTYNDLPLTANIEVKYELGKPTLYETIASKADTTTTINFTNSSVEDNSAGVYLFSGTDADGGSNPIYYYRGGDIDNNPLDNNVLFNNICWKIVRTTSTGGVKLVYNGTPPESGKCTRQLDTGSNGTFVTMLSSNSIFNSNADNTKYVGYTYDTNTPSTIKGVIDGWYSSNMTGVTDKLEDTVWCNDKTNGTTDSGTQYYAPYDRVVAGTPSLGCASDNSYTVASSKLQHPVALLTSDEIMLAGAGGGSSHYIKQNKKYYLYNKKFWWALSPYSWDGFDASGFSVNSDGSLGFDYLSSGNGVRPAVSLKPGTTATSGDGSMNSPFVIE